MYAMQNNPYQKYQEQSVMTMTQGEMLNKLFDETIKQLSAGQQAIADKDFETSNRALQKAQAIINYLRQNLNHQYEISESLDAMYEYFTYCIVQANIRKETKQLEEIIPMVIELRDAFIQADRSTRGH